MKTPFLILFTCLCLRVFAQEPATDISTADIASMESRQAGLRLAASPLRVMASNNFDVRYYRCQWDVDPAVNYIKGVVTPHFVMTAAGNSITLDLASALTVSSVQQHGSNVAFTHAADALTITLLAPLAQGVKDSITISYEGVPPASNGAFVVSTHGPSATPVLWTLSEPYGSRD
ncbi:hypothetical protein GCM10010967_45140 [Dyadobacter beijingensis]|uniref:Uncharacterized protein n=1 Tax=Dyadobacter beijingensis TaxID=365489 RepID=A0ABQ2IBJ3_9BACT|nr:hypothetical protein [Dyadobacter beijingensis]GGN05045.1 hypothetical protein GCM10010967_45140 [Dyadobacter beijingensis]